MIGKIARLVQEKGYGFIRSGNKDYFFHRSGCYEFDRLQGGESVSFEMVESSKGPRAENVELINS